MKRFTKIVSVVLLIVILCSVNICLAQLATYTGSGGSSRTIVGVANETVTNLQDVGFGTNSACLSGGLSGKTVPTSYTTYTTAGPHYYFQILPNPGYQLNVTGFDVDLRRSTTGPADTRFAYSTDGGATWTKVLFRNADTGAADMAFEPGNPDVVYASLWQMRRQWSCKLLKKRGWEWTVWRKLYVNVWSIP